MAFAQVGLLIEVTMKRILTFLMVGECPSLIASSVMALGGDDKPKSEGKDLKKGEGDKEGPKEGKRACGKSPKQLIEELKGKCDLKGDALEREVKDHFEKHHKE